MDVETDLPARRVNGRMWMLGQSGNPAGRPIGARGRFSQQFIADLTNAWEQYGADALAQTAKLYPDRFVGICSHLIPKDVSVSLTASLPGNLEPSGWALLVEVIGAVRQAVPNASSQEPGAVLEHVLAALRQAGAQVIDSCKS